MRANLTFLLLIIALITSCSDEEQPSDSRARVSYRADSLITIESVYVTVKDPSSTWNFKPENFQRSQSDTALFIGPEVQTIDSGRLTVDIKLTTPGGTQFCEGSLSAALSPNWRWRFEIVHSVNNPSLNCNDCVGSSEFDIDPPGLADGSIWVVWSGTGP